MAKIVNFMNIPIWVTDGERWLDIWNKGHLVIYGSDRSVGDDCMFDHLTVGDQKFLVLDGINQISSDDMNTVSSLIGRDCEERSSYEGYFVRKGGYKSSPIVSEILVTEISDDCEIIPVPEYMVDEFAYMGITVLGSVQVPTDEYERMLSWYESEY